MTVDNDIVAFSTKEFNMKPLSLCLFECLVTMEYW